MRTRNLARMTRVLTFTMAWAFVACDSGGGTDAPGQTGEDASEVTDVTTADDVTAVDSAESPNEEDTTVVTGQPDVDEDPNVDPLEPVVVDGVPAPGSVCPIPDPWGYAVGDTVKNIAYKDCAGNPVSIHDVVCGSAVGWVYFTYGW